MTHKCPKCKERELDFKGDDYNCPYCGKWTPDYLEGY